MAHGRRVRDFEAVALREMAEHWHPVFARDQLEKSIPPSPEPGVSSRPAQAASREKPAKCRFSIAADAPNRTHQIEIGKAMQCTY